MVSTSVGWVVTLPVVYAPAAATTAPAGVPAVGIHSQCPFAHTHRTQLVVVLAACPVLVRLQVLADPNPDPNPTLTVALA